MDIKIKECDISNDSIYIYQNKEHPVLKSCYVPQCNPSCNTGICKNDNVCDCTKTPFTGLNCNEHYKLYRNEFILWIYFDDVHCDVQYTRNEEYYHDCVYPNTKIFSFVFNTSVLAVGVVYAYSIRYVNDNFKEPLAIPVYVYTLLSLFSEITEHIYDLPLFFKDSVNVLAIAISSFVEERKNGVTTAFSKPIGTTLNKQIVNKKVLRYNNDENNGFQLGSQLGSRGGSQEITKSKNDNYISPQKLS
ncbi:hypothetical protein PIROE2DRAFT_15731 [Piromyces sp. E2]|nr:hypothetical protein PIROE2DRAFT_15731 [Piromyces sp. E2]|eukprot:OUM58904.1 hypothetical protein PIROE2DRAFT_15731 [Piromyces sp. E2]